MARVRWWIACMLVAATLAACSDPVEPHDDVTAALRVWLTANVRDYTFEVETASSWFPKSGFYRVTVEDKKVRAALDPNGKPITNFTLTVDEIWERLLAARAQGQLNSALFNDRGVPIEADMGPWPVDGGVRYSVRSFTPDR